MPGAGAAASGRAASGMPGRGGEPRRPGERGRGGSAGGREAGAAPGMAEKGAESPGAAEGRASRAALPGPRRRSPEGKLRVCLTAELKHAAMSLRCRRLFCSWPCPTVALTVCALNVRRAEIGNAAQCERRLQRALVGRSAAAISPARGEGDVSGQRCHRC